MRNDGFTLVELSIVLVIIGLLIGGILVAQSLVDSTKIQKFIREIEQFDAAVYQFQSRYNSLPGDSRPFGGDGNQIITDSAFSSSLTGASLTNAFSGEIGRFWHNLGLIGLKNPDGNGYADASVGTNNPLVTSGDLQNVPVVSIGESETVAVVFTDRNTTQGELTTGEFNSHFYQIFGAGSNMGTSSGTEFSISQEDALSFDLKTDDGHGATGDVLAQGIGGVGELGGRIGSDFCRNDNYGLATGTKLCALNIKLAVSR